MLKRILNFSAVTLRSAPLFFAANLAVIILLALAGVLSSYSFAIVTDYITTLDGAPPELSRLALPILLFFLAITVGGNTGNLTSMLETLCTDRAKRFFRKYFMHKSYREKQDSFYDNLFFDDYEFTKKHIDSTTAISLTLFNRLVGAVVGFVISGIAISAVEPPVLVVIFAFSLVTLLINQYITNAKVKLARDYTNDERKAGYFSSLLSGKAHAKELRIFGLGEHFTRLWCETFDRYSAAKYAFEKRSALLTLAPELLRRVMVLGINLYYVWLVYVGRITVGQFVFLTGMMSSLLWRMSTLVDIFGRDLAEKYRYIEKYESFTGRPDGESCRELRDYELSPFSLSEGEFTELRVDDVSYRYPSGEGNAVDGVSFKLKKGEVVSLLGYNGSGKTTLSKLICGVLRDYDGSITLNGKDIRTLAPESLYRYFGVDFQDFTRYSLTLRENIGFGRVEDIDDEKMLADALEKGNLTGLAERLPHGLDSVIGKEFDKSGEDLSGGEWQRVTLARAYMGEPEILILDEPTASVDPIEELRILEHLRELIRGKTALLISHRIGFARLSDRICIMKDGRIVEDGTHDELIARRGYYFELFMSQQRLYTSDKEAEV